MHRLLEMKKAWRIQVYSIFSSLIDFAQSSEIYERIDYYWLNSNRKLSKGVC